MTYCFFCGKDLRKGGDFVRNTEGMLLCKSCVSTAMDIFRRKDASEQGYAKVNGDIPGKVNLHKIVNEFTPKKIYDALSEYVSVKKQQKK